MKFAIAIIAGFACAADAALSTMRVGPRKLTRDRVGFEFGRLVDIRDADAAFEEVNLSHMRFLQDASFGKDSSMSFPYSSMSMPYSSMSLSYSGMSPTMPAEVQVEDETVQLLTAEEIVHHDTITVGLQQSSEADVSIGLTAATDVSKEAPQTSSSDLAYRTIAIAVLVTLGVLAFALIVFVVYRKKRATKESSNDNDGSKCDSSTVSGDDITVHEKTGFPV